MADDASFHSCCEELQHHHHHQDLHHHHQHHNHQHHEPSQVLSTKACNGGAGGSGNCCCCCYSSDTDDEAQFLTASNSPQGLEASELADFCDDVGCLGGALERTLGGDDSRRSPRSPPSVSPSSRAHPVVVASTVSAPEPLPDRLDSDSDSSSDDAVVDEEFPPPLASSSRVSLKGLRSSAAAGVGTEAALTDACKDSKSSINNKNNNNNHGNDCEDTADAEAEANADAAVTMESVAPQQLDSCQYYRDNDLTPHRPASRRTRSGPIVRQPFSSDNLMVRADCHKHLLERIEPPPLPMPKLSTATTVGSSELPADTVDFPARLRKRVRFADALGFDLASVVVIATGASGCAECGGRRELELEMEFETFLLDAESELNRGRLFAESQSPSSLGQHQQQQPETTPPPVPGWVSGTPWEPGTLTDSRPVVLESVRFDGPALELSARVLNLAPHKSLTARLTFDNWRHQADWNLRYCTETTAARQLDAGTERFRMRLYLPPNAAGLELALRYCAAGREYWDNNAGRNYVYRRENRVAQ